MADWDVTIAAVRLEFDTAYGIHNSCCQIDSNHFINFWAGNGGDGYIETFEVNTSTWAITTAAVRLEFDTAQGYYNSCYQIDSNHFINFWAGNGSDGFVQTFEVNTSTWVVTTAAVRLEFDTILGEHHSCCQIDSNHFINFWAGNGGDDYAQTFEVNTSTWVVTTAAARLLFEPAYGYYLSCYQIDSNHFINVWAGNDWSDYAQTFEVNTSTWVVTTAAETLKFETNVGYYLSCYQIDSNHFINFRSGDDGDGYVETFEVNTSTWAITTAAVRLEFDTAQGYYNSCYQIDSNHFINFWAGNGSDGFVQVFEINTSTWVVTTAAVRLEFDTILGEHHSCCQIDSNHFINFWAGNGSDGFVQVFEIELAPLPSGGGQLVMRIPISTKIGGLLTR